jgi:hypothetical protein
LEILGGPVAASRTPFSTYAANTFARIVAIGRFRREKQRSIELAQRVLLEEQSIILSTLPGQVAQPLWLHWRKGQKNGSECAFPDHAA